jgi:excisionase family DNA binding protein
MSQMSTSLSDSEFGPLVVRPARAAVMLNCGLTQIYKLIDAGELTTYLDGHARKITVESINRYIAARLAASNSGEKPEKVGKIGPATTASLAVRRQRNQTVGAR